MRIPRQLSTNRTSPHYDKEICEAVHKVFVDGVHVPNCAAYNMDGNRGDPNKGWAFSILSGINRPKVFGVVTVKLWGD